MFSEEDGPRDVVVVSLCEGLHTAGLLGGYKGEVPERLPTRTRGKGIDYTSSSPRTFRIVWGCRNGIEYHSSTVSCPVQLSISVLHESFHLVFCPPLRLFRDTGGSNLLLSS